jgi:ABC transporter transmembrane region
MPLMVVIFGNLTNTFQQVVNPDTLDASAFTALVSHYALEFVYLGIGVLGASFLGVFLWTVTGERISRRIRAYRSIHLRSNEIDSTLKQSSAKTSHSSTVLVPEKSPTEYPMMQNSFARE